MEEKAQPARRKRVDGEQSRERILDAATEIANKRFATDLVRRTATAAGLPAERLHIESFAW